MDKILSVELSGNRNAYAEAMLPLTPYEMMDVLDKLHMTPQEQPDWEILEHLGHPELHDWIGSGSLYELNALCTRLAELNVQESAVFEGLVEMEKEKGAKIIPMHRLLDLAYSTDQCHLLDDVHTTEQLGRFAAENGFIPEADDIPDEAFELLNFRKIGEKFMSGEGGVIVPGGYVAQDGDLEQDVWKTLELTPRKPDYTILVELTNVNTESTLKLSLPCDWQELDKKVSALIGNEQHDFTCNCIDCGVPALRGVIPDAGMEIGEVNYFAGHLAELSESQMLTYKAAVEAMGIASLDAAAELMQNVDEYILSPALGSFEEIARYDLQFSLGDKEASILIPHVNLYQYGRALQEAQHFVLTDYGRFQREDCQPLMAEKEQEQPAMGRMGMM